MTSAEARANKLNDRVGRYLDMFQSDDPDQVEQALCKLELVDMTLDCLTATGCGRIVNRMTKDALIGDRVGTLVQKWRAIASAESDAKKKQVVAQQYIKSEPVMVKEEVRDVKPIINKPRKRPPPADLTDFEAALLGVDNLVKKDKGKDKKKRHDVPDARDIQKELLPDIGQGSSTSTYSNFNNFKAQLSAPQGSSTATNEEAFDLSSIKRKERTKVYAGRRKAQTGLTEVPTLMQTCQRFLMEHIDQLDELGDVPFNLLECVFERCDIEQLDRISEKNPRLHNDMNKLWEQNVKKKFPANKGLEKRDASWYACYKRLCHEREQKLKSISAKIQASNQAAAPSSRTTLMTDVINPMKMQKRQIRHGIAPSTVAVADAHQVSQARRQIFHTGSKKELLKLPNMSATKGSVLAKNTNSRSSSSSKAPTGPKKGALMTKTLQMIKRQMR